MQKYLFAALVLATTVSAHADYVTIGCKDSNRVVIHTMKFDDSDHQYVYVDDIMFRESKYGTRDEVEEFTSSSITATRAQGSKNDMHYTVKYQLDRYSGNLKVTTYKPQETVELLSCDKIEQRKF